MQGLGRVRPERVESSLVLQEQGFVKVEKPLELGDQQGTDQGIGMSEIQKGGGGSRKS